MDYLTYYVYFIILIKIIFISLAVYKLYVEKKSHNKKLASKLEYWKKRVEFIFITLMALLLIYIFNPRMSNLGLINKEIQFLLYLFGFILLITAKWSEFINTPNVFNLLQQSLGNEGSR